MKFYKTYCEWYWVLPLLLITTLLGTHRLDAEGLWYDEIWSVYVAGGSHFGPLSPSEVVTRVVFHDATQGLGYPLLLAGWGSLVGWSELGIRSLSLLAGVLAVAMTYRLGSEIYSRRAGVYAALFLSVSAFFIWYTHEARTYSIVVLLSAIWLWSYQRLWFRVQSPSVLVALAFVLSGAGLLYANYFAVVLAAAGALFHGAILADKLLFRNRTGRGSPLQNDSSGFKRWVYIAYLFFMMGIVLLPSLVGFVRGFGNYMTWDDVRSRALSLPDLTFVIANYAGNSAILLLVILLIFGTIHSLRQGNKTRMLIAISGIGWLLVLVLQARMNLIEFTKVRYVLVLWSPLAVLVGIGMVAVVAVISRRLPHGEGESHTKWGINFRVGVIRKLWMWLLPLIWLIGGLNANLDSYFMTEKGWNGEIPRWRTLVNVIKAQAVPGDENDIFAYYSGKRAHDDAMSFEYTIHEIPIKGFITVSAFDPEYAEWAKTLIQAVRRVWYGMDWRLPFTEQHEQFVTMLHNAGYISCGLVVNQPGITGMELYAKSAAFCPSEQTVLQFGEGIRLTGLEPLPDTVENTLTLTMGWTLMPEIMPSQYVVGVYLFNSAGEFVAQADTGLNTAYFVMMQPTIDVSALTTGSYTVRIAVYDWQSSTRLSGVNPAAGETGDLLTIGAVLKQSE